MTLAETHGLRGYDAVQLAAAHEVNAVYGVHGLPSLTVVSAASELNAAAVREGLLVDAPNAHPSVALLARPSGHAERTCSQLRQHLDAPHVQGFHTTFTLQRLAARLQPLQR